MYISDLIVSLLLVSVVYIHMHHKNGLFTALKNFWMTAKAKFKCFSLGYCKKDPEVRELSINVM